MSFCRFGTTNFFFGRGAEVETPPRAEVFLATFGAIFNELLTRVKIYVRGRVLTDITAKACVEL